METEKIIFIALLTILSCGAMGVFLFLPIILTLTGQGRVNRQRIKEMLVEIKNDPEKLNAVKALLNGEKPTELGTLKLLLLEGEWFPAEMGPTPRVTAISEENKIIPYWQKIFQQMEENGWDINKLKI